MTVMDAYNRWFCLRPVTVDNLAVIGTLVYECQHERHLWACEFRDRQFLSGEPLDVCEECTAPVASFRAVDAATLVRYCPECGCFGTDETQMHDSDTCPTLADDYDFAAAAERILRTKAVRNQS